MFILAADEVFVSPKGCVQFRGGRVVVGAIVEWWKGKGTERSKEWDE